jgi:hypothetical protein
MRQYNVINLVVTVTKFMCKRCFENVFVSTVMIQLITSIEETVSVTVTKQLLKH